MDSILPSANPDSEPVGHWPRTLPLTLCQYETLVQAGGFEGSVGQTELIRGRIVQMNPQGPEHSDPIDALNEWSIEQARRRYTIRVEKPIRLPDQLSSPEPDLVWATRRRYYDRHPEPNEIRLLIEVSFTSARFDRTEKMELYADAMIPEYWQVDVANQIVTVNRDPNLLCYRSVQTFGKSDSISPLCLSDAELVIASPFVSGG